MTFWLLIIVQVKSNRFLEQTSDWTPDSKWTKKYYYAYSI